MIEKLNSVMLIDDDINDNFFHKRVINKTGKFNDIIVKESGEEALSYLKQQIEHAESNPDIIFLDINMPSMNGWEFLDEYEKLSAEFKAKIVVIMLSTSLNLDDQEKAKGIKIIKEFFNKPLTAGKLNALLEKYFPNVH